MEGVGKQGGKEQEGRMSWHVCTKDGGFLSPPAGGLSVCSFIGIVTKEGVTPSSSPVLPYFDQQSIDSPTPSLPPSLYPSLPPSKQYAADTNVDLKADATLSGGMFIKGFAFPKAKHDEFVAACTKPEDGVVSVYEWGYGPCDDFMTALKAQVPAAVTFNAATTPKEGGGSTVKANFKLTAASEGLFVMFENLMGQPVTFSNA
jgi:hypothetical protein